MTHLKHRNQPAVDHNHIQEMIVTNFRNGADRHDWVDCGNEIERLYGPDGRQYFGKILGAYLGRGR